MPQNPYDPYGLGIEPIGTRPAPVQSITSPNDPYGLGIEPLGGTTQPPKPPQSTLNWWMEQAARNVPPVLGGFAGSVLGAGAGGVGAVPGGVIGSGIGSGVGNLLGNWVSGQEFQPAEFAVDVGAGLIPPIFGPPKVAGAGIKELIKYTAKQAGMGALEGGLVSAASTPFQHAAQTGSFDAPLSEYAMNVGTGAGMGAALGGGLGYAHGRGEQRVANAPIEPPPSLNRTGGMINPDLNPVTEFDMRGERPPRPWEAAPAAPVQANIPPPQPRMEPTPPIPGTDTSIRPNQADPLAGFHLPKIDEAPGAIGADEVGLGDKEVTIPRHQVDEQLVQTMQEEGYEVIQRTATDVVFGKVSENLADPTRSISSMEGPPIDINSQPRRDRVALPGEERGRVADITPTRNEYQEIANRDNVIMGGVPPEKGIPIVHPPSIGGFQTHQRGNETWVTHPFLDQPAGPFKDVNDQIDWIMAYQDTPEFERKAAAQREITPDPRAADLSEAFGPRTPTEADMNAMEADDARFRQSRLSDADSAEIIRLMRKHETPIIPPTQPESPLRLVPPTQQQLDIPPSGGGLDVGPLRQRSLFRSDTPPAFSEGMDLFPPESRGISEMAAPRRPYDPRVGEDAYQRRMGTWENALNTAHPDDLKQMRQEVQSNLDNMRNSLPNYANNREATGMMKRRIGMAEKKMAQVDQAIIDYETANRRSPSFAQQPPETTIRMKVGRVEDLLRNQQGTYAEHGGRVANKELLQNAIDATNTGGTVHVTLDYNNGSIKVSDEGPGLPIDMIENEYVTLTGSGKRGVGAASGRKSIGEMGVGKATYLLGVDKFEVHTVAREPDGTLWRYEFTGDADSMIGEDANGKKVPPVKVHKTRVPEGTPTGTDVTIYDKDPDNIQAAQDYLTTFAAYSDSPVNVVLTGNKNPNGGWYASSLNTTVNPRTTAVGQHIHSGSAPGGDYQMFVPTSATWDDRNRTTAIITSRGMFQGAQSVYLGATGNLPDRIVVNIEPTVSAQKAKLYPLTSPTREKMKDPFKLEIEKQLYTHLTQAAEKARQDDLKAAYGALVPDTNLRTGRPLDFVVHDSGDRFTPDERARLVNSPHMQSLAGLMKTMLDKLDTLFPVQSGGKTHKYGFLFDEDTKGGMNVPDLNNRDQNAILVNPFSAIIHADTPQEAAARFMHIVAHEFNHNLARNEGGDFTWQLAKTLSKFSLEEQVVYKNAFLKAITGPNGDYAPGVQNLLQEYVTARGRPDTTVDLLTRSTEGHFIGQPGQGGVPTGNQANGGGATPSAIATQTGGSAPPPGGKYPPPGSTGGKGFFRGTLGWGQGATKGGSTTAKGDVNWVREALSVPSAVTTTGDLSAPGRQGLSMILTPQFWSAAGKMFKGGLSQAAFDEMNADLYRKPLMQRKLNLKTKKMDPSLGEKLGLKIYDLASKPGANHAENIASRWLETGGSIPVASAMYKNTLGVPVRASNRAFLTFLNQLSVNRTEFLMNKARDMSIEGLASGKVRPGFLSKNVNKAEAMDLNPYYNHVLGKEIVDFVNTATGHGPLRTHILPAKQAEVSLEGAAKTLSTVLFSPGLLASRIRMMNPNTYIMASPYVRKQYLKSAVSTAAAWWGFTELAKMAGGEDVQVSSDPTSADFGKVRIGDTRLDPGGGFLQFATAYGRLYQGGSTSSSTGQFHRFGEGYQAQTQEDMMQRFMVNKLNPVAKFAYDIASASQYNPFHVKDRMMQMFVPLIAQDLQELYKEDPSLLPAFGTAAMFGMGTQSYSKGESVGKLVPPENDILYSGGRGFKDLMPWNWGDQ